VGDLAFDSRAEANRERSAEPDGGESDVGGSHAVVDCAVEPGAVDQPIEHVLGRSVSIGPLRSVEQRINDVDHAEAALDGSVHVATKLPDGGPVDPFHETEYGPPFAAEGAEQSEDG
jgi:hypothetical protein